MIFFQLLTFMMDLQGDPKGLSIGGLVVITKSTSLTVKLLGTDHYFPGGDAGGGGGGRCIAKFSPANVF